MTQKPIPTDYVAIADRLRACLVLVNGKHIYDAIVEAANALSESEEQRKKMEQERDKLAQELEQAEKDAARYRAFAAEKKSIDELRSHLSIAQENFRVTNRAYVQLDIELRQRGGLIGFFVRRWVKRQLRLALTTQEKHL